MGAVLVYCCIRATRLAGFHKLLRRLILIFFNFTILSDHANVFIVSSAVSFFLARRVDS